MLHDKGVNMHLHDQEEGGAGRLVLVAIENGSHGLWMVIQSHCLDLLVVVTRVFFM